MRSSMSLICSICLVSSVLPIAAQGGIIAMPVSGDRAIMHEPDGFRHAELQPSLIRSYPHRAWLTLVLRDGTKITGRIEQLDDATFRMMDLRGRRHTVSYAQVANVSTSTRVKIAVAVATAVVVGILWKNCFYRC